MLGLIIEVGMILFQIISIYFGSPMHFPYNVVIVVTFMPTSNWNLCGNDGVRN